MADTGRFIATSVADTQFQYWLYVTFAVVVAGFSAGGRLTPRLRYLVAMLYGLASFTLIYRYFGAIVIAVTFTEELLESGVELQFAVWPLGIARIFLFGLGTFVALYFLFGERGKEGENS